MTIHELFTEKISSEAKELLARLRTALSTGGGSVWLVGGSVRDLLMGEPAKDFDFAFSSDLTPQIKAWARQTGGSWFWLDQQRLQSRVLFSHSGLQFDFSALRADDILGDLCLRDFTLNAIALPFTSDGTEYIDPLGGILDLEQGVLRSCGPTVLKDDPLRSLKGIRHFAEHGWQIDPQTSLQMQLAAPDLKNVAGERIKTEFGRILASIRVTSAIGLLHQFTVIEQLFPTLDTSTLETDLEVFASRIKQLEVLPDLRILLESQIEENISRRTLLFFAVLLIYVADPAAVAEILKRFRFSKTSCSILSSLVAGPALPSVMSRMYSSSRVAALIVEGMGTQCLEAALFALARQNNDSFDSLVMKYVCAYLKHEKKGKIEPLLDGKALMLITGLKPGQELGRLQKRIKTAEIAGEITDSSTARHWLKERFCD